MSYQELIKMYPWVDLAMEIFKGVVPTIVAIVTVIVTQHCTNKRELQCKAKEMRLDYLEKILNWIHQIKNNIFEVSEMLENALAEDNPKVREEKCKSFIKELNETNLSIATWSDTYNSVTTAFGYDVKLNDLKESLCGFGDAMNNILHVYLPKPNTSDATEKINIHIEQVMKDLNLSVVALAKEIDLLYKK